MSIVFVNAGAVPENVKWHWTPFYVKFIIIIKKLVCLKSI